MGERKGTNKYYPPDFDPKKHFNLDKYHGTHALRERAKKINQGILVIRFEMPYNIWCGGCGIHIAMGVRYNAEKSREGNYYSTPIWKFRMKCHLCDNYFEIKTDPANHDYVIINGARRKEQRWDPKENEQILMEDKNDIKKMQTDAMFKLEHAHEDKAKIKLSTPGIAEITHLQKDKKDDYALNSLARKKFRVERKYLKNEAAKDSSLLARSSLEIELVEEHKDDIRMAQLMKYKAVQSYDEKQQEKREEIQNRSLFSPSSSSSSSSSTALAVLPLSPTTSSKDSSTIISPKNLKLKEETKKKLQLAASRAKSADHSTFSSSSGKKGLAGVDLGIVRKTSITSRNEQLKMEVSDSSDISKDNSGENNSGGDNSKNSSDENKSIGASSDYVCGNILMDNKCDSIISGDIKNDESTMVEVANISDVSTARTMNSSGSGLGALVASYDTSSSSGDSD